MAIAGLLWLAYKNLAFNRSSSLLTVVAIALGTGVLSGTLSANQAIVEHLEGVANTVAGRADLILEATEPEGFEAATVTAVRDLPDVEVLASRVAKRVFFRTGDQRGFAEAVGIDPILDSQLHDDQLSAGTHLEADPSRELLVEERWAKRLGVTIGQRVDLLTRDGFVTFSVLGVLAETSESQTGAVGILRMHQRVAQDIFGLGDNVHRLDIKLSNPERLSAVESILATVVREHFVVSDTAQIKYGLQESVSDLQTLLTFFGGIALFVGAFLVYNTHSIAVTAQTRAIGLLRAAGASSRQILGLSLFQGLLLGVLGVTLGAAAGLICSVLLRWWLRTGYGLADGSTLFDPLSFLAGGGLGLFMSLLAVCLPARRASRLSPLSALRTSWVTGNSPPQTTVLDHLALAGILGFLLLWPLTEELRPLQALALAPLFLLIVRTAPAYAELLFSLSRFPLRLLFAGIGDMAYRNVRREKQHVGITVAGFLISIAFAVALGNAADSSASAGQHWVRTLFPGDYLVVAPTSQPMALTQEFSALPGVEQVSPILVQPANWRGVPVTSMGLNPSHFVSAFQFIAGERVAAFVALQRGNAVLVPAKFARDWRISVGDAMPLLVGDKQALFTVAGILAHSFPSADNYGALIVSSRDLERHFTTSDFRFLSVTVAADKDRAVIFTQLQGLAEQYGLEANTVNALSLSAREAIERVFVLFVALVTVALVIGCLGTLTTMLMNLAQRFREIGVLRAEGMTQGQVQLLITAESVILGVTGALMGIGVGTFLTWILLQLSRTPEFDLEFTFSTPVAVTALVIGVLGGILAGQYPAWVAARTNVARVVRQEYD